MRGEKSAAPSGRVKGSPLWMSTNAVPCGVEPDLPTDDVQVQRPGADEAEPGAGSVRPAEERHCRLLRHLAAVQSPAVVPDRHVVHVETEHRRCRGGGGSLPVVGPAAVAEDQREPDREHCDGGGGREARRPAPAGGDGGPGARC
jgi:hypothetical protein